MEAAKHKKRYWWLLLIGALCMSLIGGQVVAALIEQGEPEWLQWLIAIFCTICSLVMAIDGLWMIASSVSGTIKEDKILREKLKKKE